jgi:hypothetical protein
MAKTIRKMSENQALKHEVRMLRSLLKKHGILPNTIEGVINLFSQTKGDPKYAGRVLDAPLIVEVAKKFGLKFKATSCSAYLCKMVRLGLVEKHMRQQTFHTYMVK